MNADKTIVATITGDTDQLNGKVELLDEHGERLGRREFSAGPEQCAALVRAMALSISIAIDPKIADIPASTVPGEPFEPEPVSLPEDAPAPPATTPDQAAPSPVKPRAMAPSGSTPPRARPSARSNAKPIEAREPRAPRIAPPAVMWSVGVGAAGLFGVTPSVTLGAFGFVSARSGSWSLALDGRAAIPVTDRIAGVEFRTSSYSFSALPCVHFSVAFVCEVTSLGIIDAAGTAFDAPRGTSAFLSLGGRFGGELPLDDSFGLGADVEILANPWPARVFSLNTPLWDMPIVSGELGVFVAFHFPRRMAPPKTNSPPW